MSNLHAIIPCFIVARLETSLSFYVDRLGFQVHHIGPDQDPYWAIVGRDHISILLKAVAPEIGPVPNAGRHAYAPSDVYIACADPGALFEEYRAKGLSFRRELGDNSDNIRSFEIEDADGYVLLFGRVNG